jgi:hypothetical protein
MRSSASTGNRSSAERKAGRSNEAIVSRIREVLDYDTKSGVMTWRISEHSRSKGKRAGCLDKTDGYRYIRIDGQLYGEHRVAYMHAFGVIAPGLQVDHINRDPSDNRLANLRAVPPSVNACNTVRADTARGVIKRRNGSWSCQIRMDGRRVTATFATEAEAIAHHATLAARRSRQAVSHGAAQ